MPRRSVRYVVAAGTLAAGIVVAANAPVVTGIDPSLRYMVITRQPDNDTYDVARHDDGSLTIGAAPTNGGGNTRIVVARTAEQPSVDQTACATWRSVSGSDFHQEGFALRATWDDEHRRAILVTKNVWAHNFHLFNVHVYDTAQHPDPRQIGAFDLRAVVGEGDGLRPFPWRVCARTRGSTVEFAVTAVTAADGAAEGDPGWDDPVRRRTVELPPGWVTPGVAGVFAGHLQPGSSVTLDLETSSP